MDQIQIFDRPDLPPARIAKAFATALSVAQKFVGATAPNPPVGCVLLDGDGNELATAAHQKAGTLHAEALALKICAEAGTTARIHTAVVTLEPCNHHGRTPPCTEALLATPVRTVWIACRDPNLQVVGGGAARLEAASVSIRFLRDLPGAKTATLLAEADRLIAPFATRMRTGLPFVTVKQAVTATGGMIPPVGRKTFTSEASLLLAHQLRRRADAILTGSGTILADSPAFTVRLLRDHPGRHRALVVLDRRQRVAASYLAAARDRGFEPRIATDLDTALSELGAAGCLEVLLEAGPTLTQTILSRALWDEHVLIEQAEDGGADRVTVRRRIETSLDTIGRTTMFSGIIEHLASVVAVAATGGSLELDIDTGFPDLALGESIAVNGVCLTVAQFTPAGRARFFISPESLARSALGHLAPGKAVNLERAVTLNTRLSGHLVQGHVDGLAKLATAEPEDGTHKLTFLLPAELGRYCVEKGSIALNGISLTINTLEPDGDDRIKLGVTIIPHTWEHTNLHALAIGDALNVEVDVMAKYVERLCQPYL